ncbi:hypothetical protein CPR19088_GLDEOEPO_00975 [Companilactobacillus paralimentarius]
MLMKKGKEWALSCVVVSAAVLMGMSTTVHADATADNSVNSESTSTNNNNGGTVYNALGNASMTQNASANNSVVSQSTNNSSSVTQAEWTNEGTVNDKVPDGGTVRDDFGDEPNNQLGYASNFHVFANEAHLNAHTNGNVAVGDFYGSVNFGTNIKDGSLEKEVSYIQRPHDIASSSFVNSNEKRANKVVFGEKNTIDVENPNRPSVNGTFLDHLTSSGDDAINADEIYQDKNGNEYIDVAGYLNSFLSNKSTSLTDKTPQVTVTNDDFPDQNQRFINLQDYEVTNDNQIVINLDSSVLAKDTPIYIFGLSDGKGKTNVIINVDTKGQDPYTVRSQVKLIYNDGTTNNNVERPNQETEYFDDNHLLWNFYDSTASDKLYMGHINIASPFQGSVLAPKAEIEVNSNLDGNIAANKVIINSETHRWDLQDDSNDPGDETEYDHVVTIPGELPELPDEEDNEDEDNIENPDEEEEEDLDPDTGGLVDPEEPGTEEPGTEEPGTEEPDTEEPGTEEPGTEEPGTEEPGTEEPGTEEPGTEEPGTEKPDTEEPDTEKPSIEKPDTDEEDKDSEENNGNEEEKDTDEEDNYDEDGDTIIHGGSEGTDPKGDLNNGLLPNVVGNNKDVSQTPKTNAANQSGLLPQTPKTNAANQSGLLPQTSETDGVLATILGLIVLAFGLILKATHIKKED